MLTVMDFLSVASFKSLQVDFQRNHWNLRLPRQQVKCMWFQVNGPKHAKAAVWDTHICGIIRIYCGAKQQSHKNLNEKIYFRLISDPKYNQSWAARRCGSMLLWSGTRQTSDQYLCLTGFHTKSASLTSRRARPLFPKESAAALAIVAHATFTFCHV